MDNKNHEIHENLKTMKMNTHTVQNNNCEDHHYKENCYAVQICCVHYIEVNILEEKYHMEGNFGGRKI